MLYRPDAHEPLVERPWSPAAATAAVAAIVADDEAAFDWNSLWPASEWDAWEARLPLTNLYVAAAGVIWALDALRRRGPAAGALDLPRAALTALEAWRQQADLEELEWIPEPSAPSLWLGESGILLVAWLLTREQSPADDLHRRVRENVGNPANELMWGSPGTLLAATALLGQTGEARWAEARDETVAQLLADRDQERAVDATTVRRCRAVAGAAARVRGNRTGPRRGGRAAAGRG